MPRKTKAKTKKKLSTPVPKNQIGLGLILAGLGLLAVFGVWRIRELTKYGFKGEFTATNQGSQIQRIKIGGVKLDLAVEGAAITDGSWEISDSNASHWTNSANPGDGGRIVIYGHNKNNVFGPIRWLTTGEKIELIDKQGKSYEYLVTGAETVKPTEIRVVEPMKTERLTLYTCTGWWDALRYVVQAEPDK